VLFSFAREAAGVSNTRHSLRPLLSGGKFNAKLGRFRVAREKNHVNDASRQKTLHANATN
jgi:hypothetical protein